MTRLATAASGLLIGSALTGGWLLVAPGMIQTWLGAGWLPPMTEALFTLLVFAPLLALAAVGGRMTGIAAFRLGDRPGRAAAWGGLLGAAGLLLAIGDAEIAGTVRAGTGGGNPLLPLCGLAVVAFQVLAEEALFRGWLQPLVGRAIGGGAALVVVAIVFAGLHMIGGWSGPLAAMNMLGGGLLFGLLAWRDGGIGGAAAAHFAWNGTEQMVLGLDPNPGSGGFGTWWDLDLAGAATWGGSPDGLNASWPMSLALLALLVPLLMLPRRSAA